jgi:hypothetical protein
MRYRYLLVSLLGLLAGCQTYCPLRHLKPGTADINDPGSRALPRNEEMAPSSPLPLDQPIPSAR